MGYLLGTIVPSAISTMLLPLVTCALVATLGALAYTSASGLSFDTIAKSYLSKVLSLRGHVAGAAWQKGRWEMFRRFLCSLRVLAVISGCGVALGTLHRQHTLASACI